MIRTIRVVLMLSLPVALFTACAKSERTAATNPPSASKNIVKVDASSVQSHHWVQNDQLQVVMMKLGSTSAKNWPNSLPDDPEAVVTKEDRDEAFKSGAELASGLADAAIHIPGAVEALSLSYADRSAFVSTASVLGDQARLLGKAARRHNVEEMQRQLDALRATCISCHTRFKDISGALPPRV